jgi:hypothetical protein
MQNLTIEETKYTPEIELKTDGNFSIKGKSFPENTFEFYEPVMDWLYEYFQNPKPKTTLNLEILYFNSSTSKLFFDLFDIFDENRNKTDITINWIYDKENESIEESGEDFIEDFENLNINLVTK